MFYAQLPRLDCKFDPSVWRFLVVKMHGAHSRIFGHHGSLVCNIMKMSPVTKIACDFDATAPHQSILVLRSLILEAAS